MRQLRVVFMGTPEFAVASLQRLVENNVRVVGVVTAPDKPMGRGKKIGTSPVKDYALEQGLRLLQPTNLKDRQFLDQLRSWKADLQVVVAFRMLPKTVWAMPPLGTFNLHASLLPDYRGAAPINWAIINGEIETGVTTFFLKHEIDTGNIVYQEKEKILPDDSAGSLYERLMVRGADLVLKTVRAVEADDYPQLPQAEPDVEKKAPKIFKETCQIDWDQDAQRVHDFIRGLSPYPGAWTRLNNKTLKVFKSSINKASTAPGQVDSDNKSYLRFGCGSNSIDILELQIEGKRRMEVSEFLKGYQV